MSFKYPQGYCLGSKSTYASENHGNVIAFNATIYTESRGRVWAGDLDVSLSHDALKEFATEQGETIYVFRERDSARFDPGKALAECTADGFVTVHL